jgi:hypothetical protein
MNVSSFGTYRAREVHLFKRWDFKVEGNEKSNI